MNHHNKNELVKLCSKCTETSKCSKFETYDFQKNPPNIAGKWEYYEEEVQHNGFNPSEWGSIFKPIINKGEFELIQNGLFVQTKPSLKLSKPPELSVWEKIRDYKGNFINWQLNTIDTNFDNDILRYSYVSTDCHNNAIVLEGIKLEMGFSKSNENQVPEVAVIKITRIR